MIQKIGEKGLALLKLWEQGPNGGFAAHSYKCSAGKNTIGYGHVIKETDNIKEPISEIEANELLNKDLEWVEETVNKKVKISLNQNQFDSIVCLAFNIGSTNFSNSTLLKFVNEKLWDKVPDQFMRWVHCDKKVLKGLENRRKAEIELWKNSN